jgi:hypothetical protein
MIGPAGFMAAPKQSDPEPEFYSVEQAAQHAAAWCAKRPAWMRVCDMADIDCDQFYVQWSELSKREQEYWGSEEAYDEFAIKAKKVRMGHISGKGEFYSDILAVPLFHNTMQVIRVGVKIAKAARKRLASQEAAEQKGGAACA